MPKTYPRKTVTVTFDIDLYEQGYSDFTLVMEDFECDLSILKRTIPMYFAGKVNVTKVEVNDAINTAQR